jgi:hypothetical protein
MAKEANALKFVSTVLVEGGSGLAFQIPATAVTERTRWSRGQKALAKGIGGMLLGGVTAMWAPRVGAGIAISALNGMGEALAEKTKVNQAVDRLLSGSSTQPSGAIGPGRRNRVRV